MSRSDKKIAGKERHKLRTSILLLLALLIVLPPVHNANATSPSYGYERQWGSFGGPSGPNGVALDASGNLYITDAQNDAIGKIAGDGTLVALFGTPGQFSNPLGIAVDNPRNSFFVTDSVTNYVYKLTTSGVLQTSWNSNGTTNGQFSHLQGIAVNSTGYVYVVDQGRHQVGIFGNNGNFVKYFRLAQPGNFTVPFGVAVDSQGFVYVDNANTDLSDKFSGNITKYTKNGALVASWGGANQGGTLFIPQGLAVDNSSNIYVVDGLAERVQKFNTVNENLLLTWGSQGTVPGKLSNPIGVAVDSQANVFISDPSNLNIQKFSGNTGSYIATLSYQRTGRFSTPYGMSLDGLGSIYVADSGNDRVQKFNASTGAFQLAWGMPGNLNGQFNGPTGVTIDHNGKIYVTDGGNSRVQKFHPNGTFIKAWNLTSGPNGLAYPSGIVVDSTNHIYVVDQGNDRVEKFDSSGIFILQWGTTGNLMGQFSSPEGVTVDQSDRIYVVDYGNSRIEKFDSSGGFLTTWGTPGSGNNQFNSPIGITIDQSGNIYVADTYNSRVQVFAANLTFLTTIGTQGSGNGQFANPLGLVVDSSDQVYVSDSNFATTSTTNNRIEVFSPVHDTAAKKIILSRNVAYASVTISQPIKLNVSVTNFGLSTETFWVRTFANATIIGQQNVTVGPSQSMIVTFYWFPSLTRGTYTISAQTQTVPGDPNPLNNSVQGGLFYVKLKGDVTGDCKVDISDLSGVGGAFGANPSVPNWNPNLDLNNDAYVNISDLVLVASSFGSHC